MRLLSTASVAPTGRRHGSGLPAEQFPIRDGTHVPQVLNIAANKVPPYAILSHCWESEEVQFFDIHEPKIKHMAGYYKLFEACKEADADYLEYIWIDTCCIDKNSSADLSEAINSMYKWYQNARVCYVYLFDVPADDKPLSLDSKFRSSKWFRRGWTLQELLAPTEMIFFSKDWERLGTKESLKTVISEVTKIEQHFLLGERPLRSASVAKRMSWATDRETTRPEDIAYSLMGIFGVNMPMLYGEGERAFLRLQEEIMKQSDDQSIFAWLDTETKEQSRVGLLAPSPSNFKYSSDMICYRDSDPRPPYSMTNRGLQLTLPLTRTGDYSSRTYVAALDCPAPPDYAGGTFLGVYLEKMRGRDQQYARVNVGQFASLKVKGAAQTIYVRQEFEDVQLYDVAPVEYFQLRMGPNPEDYKLTSVLDATSANGGVKVAPAIPSSKGDARAWIPTSTSRGYTFNVDSRSANHLIGAVVFERSDNQALLVMIGMAHNFEVGFDVIDWPCGYPALPSELGILRERFNPRVCGENGPPNAFHNVKVSAEAVMNEEGTAKYYMIDIEIYAIHWSPLQEIRDAVEEAVTGERPRPVLEVDRPSKTPSMGGFWRKIVRKDSGG